MLVYKTITKDEVLGLDHDSWVCISNVTTTGPMQVAFAFKDDDVPVFFSDKTSHTEEEFQAMIRDSSSKWYLG
jgi:uncharacterized protein YehS (DUF1456 family)